MAGYINVSVQGIYSSGATVEELKEWLQQVEVHGINSQAIPVVERNNKAQITSISVKGMAQELR